MKRIALFLLLLIAGCGEEAVDRQIPREEAVALARDAAGSAFQALSAELGQAIADGGTVAAIPICSDKAGGLLKGVAEERGLLLLRVSDRPRNVAHAAAPADLEAMESFRATLSGGASPVPSVLPAEDGSMVVRLPIVLNQPLCLQCHGGADDISPETRKVIAARYPEDRATGYELGELRGIWRVTVPSR